MIPHPSIKGEIARLQIEVETMKKKEDDLLAEVQLLRMSIKDRQAHIARLNNLCAPIGVLPPELLAAIFQSGPCDVFDHGTYAISISQVSRHWRNVSLDIPSLWNFFRIVPYEQSSQLKMLETFIGRARSHPLSIVIDMECGSSEREYSLHDIDSQLGRVIPLVSRWRTLFIHGNFWEDVFDVCSPFEELCAPLLESFEVVVDSEEDMEDYTHTELCVFVAGAPRLSHVRVEEVSLMSCHPPLASLVSLHLHRPPNQLTPDQFWETLTASNQLRNLHIGGYVADIQFESSLGPGVQLPSLHSLTISPFPQTDLYSLLVCLNCPSLEHLTIISSVLKDDILPELANALRKTNGPSRYPLLKSLTLRYVNFIRWWEADWLVTMLPSITHLVIYRCVNPATLLDRLLPLKHVGTFDEDEDRDESGPVSWPLLQTICLSKMLSSKLEVLYDVIADRISRGIPLACVKLDSINIPEDRLEWLQARVRVEIVNLDD